MIKVPCTPSATVNMYNYNLTIDIVPFPSDFTFCWLAVTNRQLTQIHNGAERPVTRFRVFRLDDAPLTSVEFGRYIMVHSYTVTFCM